MLTDIRTDGRGLAALSVWRGSMRGPEFLRRRIYQLERLTREGRPMQRWLFFFHSLHPFMTMNPSKAGQRDVTQGPAHSPTCRVFFHKQAYMRAHTPMYFLHTMSFIFSLMSHASLLSASFTFGDISPHLPTQAEDYKLPQLLKPRKKLSRFLDASQLLY